MKDTQHAKALGQNWSPDFLTPGLPSSQPLSQLHCFSTNRLLGLPSGLVDGGVGL